MIPAVGVGYDDFGLEDGEINDYQDEDLRLNYWLVDFTLFFS